MKAEIPFSYSPLESNRFGLNVYRGQAHDIDHKQILETVLKNNVDVLIFRIPCEKQDTLHYLERTGLPYLIADTLVYYHNDLINYTPKPLRNKDLEFIRCNSSHLETIDHLISESFAGYKNHYLSNPLLSFDLSEAYKEWAHAYLSDDGGKCTWLVQRDGKFIGFIACAFHDNESEFVLNGVLPSVSGAGIYTDLVRFTQMHFKQKGFETMKTSTQINNYAVQKVWSKEGFVLRQSYITVHVNAMMKASLIKKKIFQITLGANEFKLCDELDGTVNHFHFNDDCSQEKGFSEKIAHSFSINPIISKYYCAEFPGDGTVFLDYFYKLLKPIYLDKKYNVEIGFPFLNEEKGIYKSLIKVFDPEGEVCLFSYNNLMKK